MGLSPVALALSIGRGVGHGTFCIVKKSRCDGRTGDGGVVGLLVGVRGIAAPATTGAFGNIGGSIDASSSATTSESEKEERKKCDCVNASITKWNRHDSSHNERSRVFVKYLKPVEMS